MHFSDDTTEWVNHQDKNAKSKVCLQIFILSCYGLELTPEIDLWGVIQQYQVLWKKQSQPGTSGIE